MQIDIYFCPDMLAFRLIVVLISSLKLQSMKVNIFLKFMKWCRIVFDSALPVFTGFQLIETANDDEMQKLIPVAIETVFL